MPFLVFEVLVSCFCLVYLRRVLIYGLGLFISYSGVWCMSRSCLLVSFSCLWFIYVVFLFMGY